MSLSRLLAPLIFLLVTPAMRGADDKQFVLEGFEKEVSDADVAARAKGLTGVGAVRVDRAKVSDASFAVFARWPDLYGVYLRDTQAAGTGFSRLEKHEALRQVTLVGPKVSGAGVRAGREAGPRHAPARRQRPSARRQGLPAAGHRQGAGRRRHDGVADAPDRR